MGGKLKPRGNLPTSARADTAPVFLA